MSNYGYNYGDLEDYARNNSHKSDMEYQKIRAEELKEARQQKIEFIEKCIDLYELVYGVIPSGEALTLINKNIKYYGNKGYLFCVDFKWYNLDTDPTNFLSYIHNLVKRN